VCFCYTKTFPGEDPERTCFALPMVAQSEERKEEKTMEIVKKQDRLKKSKGGRPVKAVKRENDIRVRLTQTEHFLISEKAKKAGMTISEWFRRSAVKGKVLVRVSTEDLKVLRTLSGMANNLNQLTKLAHQQGFLVVQRKCRELLSDIDDTLKKLSRDDR